MLDFKIWSLIKRNSSVWCETCCEMKIIVSWDMTPRWLVICCRLFGGVCFFRFHAHSSIIICSVESSALCMERALIVSSVRPPRKLPFSEAKNKIFPIISSWITLMMETARSFQTSVTSYQSTIRSVPEDSTLLQEDCWTRRSLILTCFYCKQKFQHLLQLLPLFINIILHGVL